MDSIMYACINSIVYTMKPDHAIVVDSTDDIY